MGLCDELSGYGWNRAVHHRQRAAARAVRVAHRLEERRRRGRRPCPVGPVGAAGGERAAPDAQLRVDRLERVVGSCEQREVGRRRRVRTVEPELREPEAVEVRLVADDHVVEGRHCAGERGRVLREPGLRGGIERRRPRAGVVHRHVDAAVESGGRLDVAEHGQLAGSGRDLPGKPVRRDPRRREAREPGWAIFAFAVTRSAARTVSSAAPRVIEGPPARAASRARNTRRPSRGAWGGFAARWGYASSGA